MIIVASTLKKWRKIKSYGDFQKIVAENPGISNNDVTRAMRGRGCRDEVFAAISKFYKEKEEKLKEYL